MSKSLNNLYSVKREVIVTKKQEPVYTVPTVSDNSKLTYINGILLVNKKYKLPTEDMKRVREEIRQGLIKQTIFNKTIK